MSWQNGLALAVFVVVCGFIAYAGDVLGRRMGKRRLTLFGMRPRYTAIVTTTITGMLIAIFTIAAMSAASRQVRLLILRGAEILHKQEAEVARQKQIADAAHKAAQKAEDQQKALTAAAEKLTAELDDLRSDLSKNKAALARAEAERRRLTTQRNKLNADIEHLRTDVDKNRVALEKAEADLQATEDSLKSAEDEIAKRREEITEQESQIAKLEAQRADALSKNLAKWETPVIFRPGEEIVRGAIDCTRSEADIRSSILSLLDDADLRARAEGAKIGDNRRSVEIVPKEIHNTDGKSVYLDEEESIDLIVKEIATGSGTVVARVFSWGNSFEGEQSLVELGLNYNRLVYAAGDEVASTTIDGSVSRGRILEGLIVFLRGEVRSAAMHRGVIPTYDDDGQPSVGSMSIDDWDQVFDLVDRVKAAGKQVRVRATAKRDTWSADSLSLNLIVDDQ